jgi:3-hydroxy acid dehydrogenase/malonic semialdehyde reductase
MKRTIIVTGASSGFGLKICEHLLEDGHKVIGIARSIAKSPLKEHALFIPFPLDLRKFNADALAKRFPDADTIIANAGLGHFGNLEELSHEKIQEVMDLNFFSSVFLTKAFLPSLKKKKRADLIFIGSEAALQGKKKGTIYCASKFALRGFAQALREECASSSVRVSLIQPGMARTPFYDNLHFEPSAEEHSALEAEDVAQAVRMVLQLHGRAVCEEIVLSPLKKSLQFKNAKRLEE